MSYVCLTKLCQIQIVQPNCIRNGFIGLAKLHNINVVVFHRLLKYAASIVHNSLPYSLSDSFFALIALL